MRRLVGLVVLFATLWVAAVPATAAPSHPFLYSIHKFVSQPNVFSQFEGPCGLAVDSSGDLYVSDYYHDEVSVFSGGGFKTKLDGVEPLSGPCGLAVGAAGELFVNVFHRDVVRFTPASFPLAAKTAYGPGAVVGPGQSTGVAVDPASGDVYVNNRTHVAVYDSTGAPVEAGGEPLRIGLGSLGDAYGVAVSAWPGTAGRVYVPDAATSTIAVFDPAIDPVDPIATIDGGGTPQGGFRTLRDAAIAVDRQTGHVLVVHNAQGPFHEHPRAAVAEFNAAGEYRGTVPAPTPLWFGEPSGIAVDNSATVSAGRVYVTTGNSELESSGRHPERVEESAVYAFGPSAPGLRLEVALAGAGEGGVKSSPAGIACAGACAAEYDEGTQVTLSAAPTAGSTLAGWSGCDTEPGGNCRVAMNAARTVEAQFEPISPLAMEGMAATDAAATQRVPGVPDPASAPPRGLSAAQAAVPRRQAARRAALSRQRAKQRQRTRAKLDRARRRAAESGGGRG